MGSSENHVMWASKPRSRIERGFSEFRCFHRQFLIVVFCTILGVVGTQLLFPPDFVAFLHRTSFGPALPGPSARVPCAPPPTLTVLPSRLPPPKKGWTQSRARGRCRVTDSGSPLRPMNWTGSTTTGVGCSMSTFPEPEPVTWVTWSNPAPTAARTGGV